MCWLGKRFSLWRKKIREEDRYILLRDLKPKQSDIDVELLIDWGKIGELDEAIKEIENKGIINRETEKGSINLAFYPYSEVMDMIRNPYSSVLQRYAVWSNRTIVFLGLDRIIELRVLSRETINNSLPEEQKWFWGNLADRYLFHQRRLLIKIGQISEIIITSEEAPTLFDPKFRLQPRTKYTYLLTNATFYVII